MTPVTPVMVSPPRSVLLALSGCPPRPKTMGSGFCRFDPSSMSSWLRSFWACRALACSPGSTTLVG
jgi:hypothetical protein